MTETAHTWRFFRAGGSDQVAIERAQDLQNLHTLDPKLWVALACPVKGLEVDERTLTLMDADGDGRLRVPEILNAVSWACAVLSDPAVLLRGGDLPLDAINAQNPDGARILASARQILKTLGKADARTITVADTMETVRIFELTRFNGDGVVPIAMVDDGALRDVATLIAETLGAVDDRSGKPGVSQAKVDEFFGECEAFVAWWAQSENDRATLLPLGDATLEALRVVNAVRGKVDDYFARCRLVAFDARSAGPLNRQESEYIAIAEKELHKNAEEVAGFPLARVDAGRALPLATGLNPAWAGAIDALRTQVVTPLLGDRTELSEAEWNRVTAAFAAHEAWAAGKTGARVEKIGIAKVRELLAGPAKGALTALIAEDAALAPEMDAIDNVERLARFQRDLATVLHNFVSFRDFYGREKPAVFQAGTLFLDGRSCDLCVRVDDMSRHAALAGLAKCYLAYCECTRPSGERMMIAAAFTAGDSDNLMAGRNGVFYDRKGRDWDATIIKVIDNPISIKQAFWAPYTKLVRLIEEQVAKRAATGAAAHDARLGSVATTAATLDTKPPEPKKIDVGTVAALGVAVGAIGAFFATMLGLMGGVFENPFWKIVLIFIGVMVAISMPWMLMAWLKLRQRNLGPLLDAGGWAVNGRVKMNVPFGGSLTHEGNVPFGAQSSFVVRYPEPPTVLPKLVAAGVFLAFVLSLLTFYKVIGEGGLLDFTR